MVSTLNTNARTKALMSAPQHTSRIVKELYVKIPIKVGLGSVLLI